MPTVLEAVQLALEELGGEASLKKIYARVKHIRPSTPAGQIRTAIYTNSSDCPGSFSGIDLFYTGRYRSVWGLRSHKPEPPATSASIAPSAPAPIIIPEPLLGIDLDIEALESESPERALAEVSRIIRDPEIVRKLKVLHKNECQICGFALDLLGGKTYSEGHHIRPLGIKHNGPDIPENILILCPNHHALCDFGAIELDLSVLKPVPGHNVSQEYINYHNGDIFNKS